VWESFCEEITVPTVLVVDDSAVDRRLAGSMLEKHFDCTIQYAADGQEALRQLAVQVPDLVLTDLQMPGMDGLELVTAIKNDYPLVPVILMTAQGSEDIAAQALRRGAASYVPKRKLAVDLMPTIERILLGSYADRMHTQLMHYLETTESVFALSNDLALIKSLVDHVQQLLRCLPLADEMDRLRVGIALEEALTNACYHGNLEIGTVPRKANLQVYEQMAEERRHEAPYRERSIHVVVRISRREAVFVIRDEGPGFDTSRLPTLMDLSTEEGEAGRGIILMHTIMDEVKYNSAGNEVTLVKRRAPEAILVEDGLAENSEAAS
jgi:CheY-like chemotaxis protein